MEICNLKGDEWNLKTEHEDYVFKDCWVGARIGAELIGGSVYEVAPAKKQGPYHTHHGNEEWAIVIRGRGGVHKCGPAASHVFLCLEFSHATRITSDRGRRHPMVRAIRPAQEPRRMGSR